MGQNVSCLMPEPFASHHHGYMSNYLSGGAAKVLKNSVPPLFSAPFTIRLRLLL
jgi:hypothetical protein